MCSPSYGCCETPVVARMCVYTAQKMFSYIKSNYKEVLEQEQKTLKNEQNVGMLLQKRTDTRGAGISIMR